MADKIVQLGLTGDDSGLTNTLDHSKGKLNEFEGQTQRTTGVIGAFNGHVDAAAGIVRVFSGALAGVSLSLLIRELGAAGMAAERLSSSFEAATGSAQLGAVDFAFVRVEANRLGLDLQHAADAYVKLTAASKGTYLEGEHTRRIFSAVAEASRALGLSTEETKGAITAISQMISKGSVQSEELRGQLGERLPGAFQIAARAMGVTTAELGKMLQDGKIIADEFLPKFATELQKTFPAGQKAVSGLSSEVARLKTSFYDLKVAVMESGGNTMFTGLARQTRMFTQDLTDLWHALDRTGTKWLFLVSPALARFAAQQSGAMDYHPPVVNGTLNPSKAQYEKDLAAFLARETGTPSAPPKKEKKGLTEDQRLFLQHSKEQVKDFFRTIDDEVSSEIASEQWIWNKFELLSGAGLRGSKKGMASVLGRTKPTLFSKEDQEAARLDAEEKALNEKGQMSERQQGRFDLTAAQYATANRDEEYRQTQIERETAFAIMKNQLRGDTLNAEMIRIDMEEQAWMATFDNYEGSEQKKAEVAKIYGEQRLAAVMAEEERKRQIIASSFGNMATVADAFYKLSHGKNQAAFRSYQALKSGETIISTASGVMKAMSTAPNFYVGLAQAAATAAMGAVQLAAIWSASPEGSRGGSGGVGSYDGGYDSRSSSPVVVQPLAQQSAGPQITIIMNNPIGEKRWFEDNVPEMFRDFAVRNVNAGVVYAK